MKKLLSLLCVCAVAVSLLTSFVSVSASAAPSITYELNFANTGETLSDAQDANWEYDSLHGVAPLYKATLTLKGAVAKTPVRDESNTIVAFTGSLVNGIQAAIKYQSSQNVVMIASEVLAGGAAGSDISDPTVLTASWGTATTSQFLKADTVVATWYFFEASGAEITDMKLSADSNSINKVVVGEFYDGTSKTAQKNVDVSNIKFIDYPVSTPSSPITTKNKKVGNDGAYNGKTLIHVAQVLKSADPNKKVVITKKIGDADPVEQVSDRTLSQILGGVAVDNSVLTGEIAIGVLTTDTTAVFGFELR